MYTLALFGFVPVLLDEQNSIFEIFVVNIIFYAIQGARCISNVVCRAGVAWPPALCNSN